MRVSIYCENNHIYARGISSLLFDRDSGLEDSEIAFDGLFFSFDRLLEACTNNENETTISIYYSRRSSEIQIEQLKKLRSLNSKKRILLITDRIDMTFISQIVRAGAKGLLVSNCTANELVQGVLTIKNGYDYFGHALTQQLIQDRVSKKTGSNGNDLETAVSENRPVEKLTKREIEIMRLWGEGLSNPEISDCLCISVRTVESHKNHIMQKLNIKNTVDLIKFGIRNNLIDL